MTEDVVVGILRPNKVIVRVLSLSKSDSNETGIIRLISSGGKKYEYKASQVAREKWNMELTRLIDSHWKNTSDTHAFYESSDEYEILLNNIIDMKIMSIEFGFHACDQPVSWLTESLSLSSLRPTGRKMGLDLIIRQKTRLVDRWTLAYVGLATFMREESEEFLRLNALVVYLYKHSEGYSWISCSIAKRFIRNAEELALQLPCQGSSAKTDGRLVCQSIRTAAWHFMLREHDVHEVYRLLIKIGQMNFDDDERPVYALNRSKSLMLLLATAIARRERETAYDIAWDIFGLFYEAASRFTESIGWFGDFRWIWENAYLARKVIIMFDSNRKPPKEMLDRIVRLSLRADSRELYSAARRYINNTAGEELL
ncbi:hypothetical protein [Wenzhouxiangella sp. EGI_FJ10305]|uniref:hypothetical protein n=1 Tax=Wenzhouxiangella sp. EGI_FJ10305 TaxID=3243768 RepID=UPI0035DCAA10